MPITVRSFAEWLEPGPEVFPKSQRPLSDVRWATEIPRDSRTRLVPAIPSVLGSPDVKEWKKELSSLEWQLVGPTWTAIGRQILARDPWFGFVKHTSYIDTSGRFTATFKSKDWRPQYIAQLAWRMDEELSFYGALLNKINDSSSLLSELSPEVIEEERKLVAGPDGDEIGVLWRFPWRKAFEVGVKYGPSAVRSVSMYSAQGIIGNLAWEAATQTVKWGIQEYKQNQRAQERREKQKRKGLIMGLPWDQLEENEQLLLTDPEISEDAVSLGDALQRGFILPSGSDYVGTWAVPASPAPSSGQWYRGFLPKYLESRDGIYQ